jgi:predicted acetylornithine/succinylornithine family transaminase/N-acetyl-ornithine/N-acetyl-lysine deacetylase
MPSKLCFVRVGATLAIALPLPTLAIAKLQSTKGAWPDMNATLDLENTYTSGVYGKRQVAIVRGQGALLWDEEGREYIDCMAGHGVANIGHGRPEIAAALAAQASRLITCPEIVYNDVRARLLERLALIVPQDSSHIFLCNSGTEAVEGAMKFARIATGRTGIIAALRSFHGRTMGALSATWEPHYREPFAPLVPGVSHIRYNDLASAENAITEETAAVMIELVQGEGGVHVATEAFVQGIAVLCRERGALLIIDEVQTGFGRTGRMFACEHYTVQPDILCLAKSLAGGIPMGAVCLGSRVMESGHISRGVHGSTFGGNPLACAAALTTLTILESEALPERAAALGAYTLERLQALQAPLIREVRGRGLLIGIELTRRAQPYLEALLDRSILALPAGPNVIRLLPPLVITEEQLDQVVDGIAHVLNAPLDRSPLNAPLDHAVLNASRRGPIDRAPRRHIEDAPVNERTLTPPPDPVGRDQSGRDQSSPHARELSLLQTMLTIPSYSGQEGTLAHFLVEQAERMGLHAYMDEAGNFIADTHQHINDRDVEQQPIVLLGHMDTVGGVIPVRIEDDLLYGRGAVDAKGPLAAFLCAAARITKCIPADSFQHPLVVIGSVEEEAATSRGARAVVERYRPSACIIGEPSGSSAVTIGYKGRLLVDYCLERSISHSAGPCQNSSEGAVAFWNRVQQHAEVWNRENAGESTFAALLPSLRNIESEQDGLVERTRLRIGYRLPPNFNIAELRTLLARWAMEDGAHLIFTGEERAFQTSRTSPLARAFTKAIRATDRQPTFKLKTGTSDMNVVGPVWGENIVAYGPGDSRLDHTPHEHISITEYVHAIDVLEQVLRELSLRREGCA